MEEKYYKEISKKLTIIIKLLMRRDEKLAKGGVESLLDFLEGTDFSNQEIAEISGVATKTVANIKSKIKSVENSKGGNKNGK